jgi:fumarylacetoacetase
MHLPMQVSGFVDFLTSTDHAERAGRAFGQGDLPLNFYHLPTAYNGRASTVVVSGTEIVRPWVQSRPEKAIKAPKWSPCQAMDYELEMVLILLKVD